MTHVPLLHIQELRVYYSAHSGFVRAVDNVSFDIDQGEAVALVGESGAGKTTLGLALMRLLPKNLHTFEGIIQLAAGNLLSLPEAEFHRQVRWRQIAMVFQGAMNSLNPVLRVGFQVAEPLLESAEWSRPRAEREAERLLHLVGLPSDVSARYPHELSGGMKQRVVIAMALVLQPHLLILDEPTSALDVSVQAHITNLLKRLKRELGLTLLFITHDVALASEIADRIAVFYAGELVELASADELLTTPQHPYAQKLLASLPQLETGAQPDFIPGAPPDLRAPPPGCRFHPRCPYVFARCRIEHPPLLFPRPRHPSRCWLHVERPP